MKNCFVIKRKVSKEPEETNAQNKRAHLKWELKKFHTDNVLYRDLCSVSDVCLSRAAETRASNSPITETCDQEKRTLSSPRIISKEGGHDHSLQSETLHESFGVKSSLWNFSARVSAVL